MPKNTIKGDFNIVSRDEVERLGYDARGNVLEELGGRNLTSRHYLQSCDVCGF